MISAADTPYAQEELQEQYLAEVRPGNQDTALPIKVGIIVIDIDGIDGAQQSFVANFALIAEWKDPRLAADIDHIRIMKTEDIWTPYLQILNQQKLFETFPDQVQVLPDGTVSYVQRYWGTMSYPMNLEDFPTDKHFLQIKIVTVGKDAQHIKFSINEEKSGMSEVLTVTDWDITGWDTFTEPMIVGPKLPPLPGVVFQFEAERLVGFYFIKVLVPLIMIVFISLIVLFIDPSHIGPKFSIAITAILTLIAYRFLLGNLLPKISYLTHMDYFLFGSMFLVFAVLVETSIVARLVGRDKEKEAKTLDYWCRGAFIILFVIILVGSFIL
ncbi:MAG: hypothetical protein DHS20C13_03290 [Thermodesulfobacteriota bacterium]|nr:MAG: hypothetical protein DHS20C13_03290 [Thermodesulfobacteriota bacterium]